MNYKKKIKLKLSIHRFYYFKKTELQLFIRWVKTISTFKFDFSTLKILLPI